MLNSYKQQAFSKYRRTKTMNEKEQMMVAKIMEKVYDFHLSKYHYLFLSQMAIRRYELSRKKKKEDIEKTAVKIMSRMPELCKKSQELKHKNIILTSAKKSLERLEEELCDSETVDEGLLRGPVVENVLEYLIEE